MRGIERIPWLYDLGMGLFERLGMGRWRHTLVAGVRGRVLEVGCGTGRGLTHYGAGVALFGVDPDLPALRRAQRRAPQAGLAAARAEALPFPDAAFDTVVTSLSFCSVDDVPQGLAELRRVLRDDGELRMLEHVRSEGALTGRGQDAVQPAWTVISGGCRPNRRTEAAVEAAGFRIDPDTRIARGVMRCFTARKAPSAAGAAQPQPDIREVGGEPSEQPAGDPRPGRPGECRPQGEHQEDAGEQRGRHDGRRQAAAGAPAPGREQEGLQGHGGDDQVDDAARREELGHGLSS